MNNKIFFLVVLQVCLFTIVSHAQPCQTPPQCITDHDVTNTTLNVDWHISHGYPTLSTNSVPGSGGGSLRILANPYYNEGLFTCYDFKEDNTYRVCFWVRSNAGCPTTIQFIPISVYAANDLGTNASNLANVTHSGVQKIYEGIAISTHHGPGQNCISEWEFMSFTFTANQDLNNLWFYNVNNNTYPTSGTAWNEDFVLEIDEIRVEDITGITPATFMVTGNNTIDGCNATGTGQTTLTIEQVTPTASSPMPSNYVANWVPQPFSWNSNKSIVNARPCSTTTYRIDISDPSSSTCPNCVKETIYYTVNVNQWSDASNIVYPTTVVPCGSDINLLLDYNDPGTCPGTTYTWIEPNKTAHSGKNPTTIPLANALQSGEWTLQVFVAGKNCAEEHKFFISVGPCCFSNPSFTSDGNNPMSFQNTSTGGATHIATLWNFGDGTISDQMNPTHSYNTSGGSVWVCLTMMYMDDQGESCCEQHCELVDVPPSPCVVHADFDYVPDGGQGPYPSFYFLDLSSGNGTICRYEWNFGDGSPPLIIGPYSTLQHSMGTGPGPWWVCLTVTNCITINGVAVECTDTKCKWVYAEGAMVVKREPESPSNGVQPPPELVPLMPGSTNVVELGNSKTLTVFPNPNAGNFSLSLSQRIGSYQVVVRDQTGKELYNRMHEFTNTPVEIQLNNVADGIYSVEVLNDSEKFVQQVRISK